MRENISDDNNKVDYRTNLFFFQINFHYFIPMGMQENTPHDNSNVD